MERTLKIKEEDLGTAGELLMRDVIFDLHRHDDGTHILDICEDEDKFKNLVSIFFAYANKQRLDFSGSFSNGVGRIRLGKKRRFINGAIL
jgi:predicted RNA-binding protein